MIKTYDNNKQSAFIIPYHANAYDQLDRKKLVIADTVEGLFAQTDQEWSAIIIADPPLKQESLEYLKLRQQYYPTIDVIFLEQNVSPGTSRK